MTTIAVYFDHEAGRGAIATDSQTTAAGTYTAFHGASKIVKLGKCYWAGCGSMTLGSIVKHELANDWKWGLTSGFEKASTSGREACEEWAFRLNTELCKRLKERNGPKVTSAGVLLTPYGICVMASDGSAKFIEDRMYADGSGGELALGAMTALGDVAGEWMAPKDYVREAVNTAILHDVYSGGAVHVATIGGGG